MPVGFVGFSGLPPDLALEGFLRGLFAVFGLVVEHGVFGLDEALVFAGGGFLFAPHLGRGVPVTPAVTRARSNYLKWRKL